MRPYLFSMEGDLQTCRKQLEDAASRSHKYNVFFTEQHNRDASVDFKVRRKDPHFKAASPKFHGALYSSEGMTQLSGQVGKSSVGTFLIKLWCWGAAGLGAIALGGLVVSALRVRAAGFDVQEPLMVVLAPLLFVIAGLFMPGIVQDMQRKQSRELIEWLFKCFDIKSSRELTGTADVPPNQAEPHGLNKPILILSATGLLFGAFTGFANNVESYLDPLQITVTDIHACAPSDDGSGFVRKEIFKPTEVVHGCGHLEIEIIDHRQIAIEIWLRRDYDDSSEGPSGYISHVVTSEGKFALPLRAPKDGRYQIGQYTMQIGRGKTRYGNIIFDVVE